MRIDKRAAAATALLSAVTVATGAGMAASEAAPAETQLRGTWQVVVDPATPPGGPDFESTLSFGQAGVVTEATSKAPSSAGLGAWQRTGPKTFEFRFQKYRFDGATYLGKTVVHESVTVNDDGTYAGSATTLIVNAAGAVVMSFDSTSSGTRYQP